MSITKRIDDIEALELARALAHELWSHIVNEETDEPWTLCEANALLDHPLVRDVQDANRVRYAAFLERQRKRGVNVEARP